MERRLICPRTEICCVYRTYVENTSDDAVAIIRVTTIESHDFYSCRALAAVLDFARQGKLQAETAKRLEGTLDCLMIDQANRMVERRRPDY
ncbi:MAG: hypothetical protein ACYTBJ_04475 [Planctomycetota bacterium]|jgi:hypothetical protein